MPNASRPKRNSGIFIFPTESSYALGCRYNDAASIRQITRLKGRTDTRFTLVASSLQQVKKHFALTRDQLQLAKHYWPGAISIVVSPQFAIRVPGHNRIRMLADHMGVPLIATSLNKSGEPPIYDLQQLVGTTLELSLHERDIQIIDIGPLPHRPPSTIVECFRGGYVIHRSGAVELI